MVQKGWFLISHRKEAVVRIYSGRSVSDGCKSNREKPIGYQNLDVRKGQYSLENPRRSTIRIDSNFEIIDLDIRTITVVF
jgi:hypothetical protein